MNSYIGIKRSILKVSVLFILLLASGSYLSAQEEHATEAHSVAGGHEQGVSETFDPTSLVMHHIADANEWDVALGFKIPLPIIIYNRTSGTWFTGLSSAFASDEEGNGTVEVEGFHMHHSRVVPVSEEDKYIDFSITKNVFTMLLSAILMLIIFLGIAKSAKASTGKAPKGLQNALEPIILFIKDEVIQPNLGKQTDKFLPYLLTVFFFIWVNNLLGLIPIFPGGGNVMGNIAVTFTLAVITMLLINLNGNKHYWQHIFWMPGTPVPVRLIMLPIELIGVISKPFALMIRLFANITAGHIVVLSLVCLIFVFGQYNPVKHMAESPGGAAAGAVMSVVFVMFISLIELLVAFLQAFIFTMLSSVFIGIAVEEHHEEHH